MKRSSVPVVVVDPALKSLVSSSGGLLLTQTMRCSGLDSALSTALAPWRVGRAVDDPAKVLLDLAIAVALGGDCAADIAVVRAQPALFSEVASDATVSRLIASLADDPAATQRRARAARQRLTSDFDWHTVADETAQVYLAAKRRERRPLPRLPIVEHALPER